LMFKIKSFCSSEKIDLTTRFTVFVVVVVWVFVTELYADADTAVYLTSLDFTSVLLSWVLIWAWLVVSTLVLSVSLTTLVGVFSVSYFLSSKSGFTLTSSSFFWLDILNW
jgi:hypothetical protein